MVSVAHYFLTKKWIPWRVRNYAERLIEEKIRERAPSLYRIAHFGRHKNIVRRITDGPSHHFFGYYDKCPWNRSSRYLLSHRVEFMDRPPEQDDEVCIGYSELENGNTWYPLARTKAWNWQQGAMLRWNPASTKNVLFNDRDSQGFVGISLDIVTGEKRVYPKPIYTMTQDGTVALSLNFARLHINRPGYGYVGIQDRWADDPHPSEDGIYRMDMQSGDYSLILSLHDLANYQPDEMMTTAKHWVNHLQINPDGTRFLFLHRWSSQDVLFHSRLFSMALDGSELKLVLDYGMVSHYDWFDNENLLVWGRHPMKGDRYYLINVPSGAVKVMGDDVLTCDGHCSFSPNKKWILTDTYPDQYGMRTLILYRMSDGKRIDVDRFYSPKEIWGEIRCDLHPRWNPDGTQVCIDSVHEGQRQVYVVDVSSLIQV
uniref:Uncharacterized protein n=1 Tax=Candidatus Methanogaster sp. ANME-2c ERB4 TaxID=2759911 RepID=A0A7G9YB84_9EURY|nr:hypothetical protein GHMBFEBI_00002 [Methanosarcinales archaeon ANME-2c ERB4]QNO46810.1 hypothetical protein FAOAFBCF_00008 [Methanosarcinales archaeon ANME-2c ERB4]